MFHKLFFKFFQVRTKTLVKNAIVVIDATPFRQWYEAHYALPLGHKKNAKLTEAEEALLNKKRSNKTERKFKERQKQHDCKFTGFSITFSIFFCRIVDRFMILEKIMLNDKSKSLELNVVFSRKKCKYVRK